ncbi:MAG TPA: DUF1634 domain-containing protein [Candidatus Acidoferrales bacterium]|jgi:uncharacterized membrane protein|nr:DUF1634 domain-containing protein [Candidatus Acidoferrales bacterium]
MNAPARPMSDKRAEEIIGNLLRTGVSIAAIVVFAAGIPYLIQHGAAKSGDHTFQGEPSQLRHISGIIKSSLAGDAAAIIQFGILILIATPVARVAFSVFAFVEERDWLYVIVTLIVLALLLFSLTSTNL